MKYTHTEFFQRLIDKTQRKIDRAVARNGVTKEELDNLLEKQYHYQQAYALFSIVSTEEEDGDYVY